MNDSSERALAGCEIFRYPIVCRRGIGLAMTMNRETRIRGMSGSGGGTSTSRGTRL